VELKEEQRKAFIIDDNISMTSKDAKTLMAMSMEIFTQFKAAQEEIEIKIEKEKKCSNIIIGVVGGLTALVTLIEVICWHTISYIRMQYVMAFWAFWTIMATMILILCALVRVQITNRAFGAVSLRNVYIIVHITLLTMTATIMVIMVIIALLGKNVQRFELVMFGLIEPMALIFLYIVYDTATAKFGAKKDGHKSKKEQAHFMAFMRNKMYVQGQMEAMKEESKKRRFNQMINL
jgi:hypothetical protein